MANETIKYKQCVLRKGYAQQVSYLPSKFAIDGKLVRLKDDDGWEVVFVSDNEITEDLALLQRDVYRNHRNTTDV